MSETNVVVRQSSGANGSLATQPGTSPLTVLAHANILRFCQHAPRAARSGLLVDLPSCDDLKRPRTTFSTMAAMMEEAEHDQEMEEEESTSNSIGMLEQHGINNGDVNKVRESATSIAR